LKKAPPTGKRAERERSEAVKMEVKTEVKAVMEDGGVEVMGEEELARAMEELAREHPDVVIEKVREWLDACVEDTRGRLEAVVRSEERVRRELETIGDDKCDMQKRGVGTKIASETEEYERGICMIEEYAQTLALERTGLQATLQRWEAIRTRAEFESSKLALGWLHASNRDSDEDGDVDDNCKDRDAAAKATAHKGAGIEYCSTAYAFVRVAVGVFMAKSKVLAEMITPAPAKSTALLNTESPTGVLDAAWLSSPLSS
jgi:hypothetical protein